MKNRIIATCVWFMLIALAASNALLIRQNLQLRAELEKTRPRALRIGETVPPFEGTDIEGRPILLNYTGEGPARMLLYFTPTCRFCKEQFPYWNEVLRHASGSTYEVVGLVSDREDKIKLTQYLREMSCGDDSPAPLRVMLLPKEVSERYHLSATPATLLISNKGTVQKVWVGRWVSDELQDVSAALGFNLKAH